MKTTSTLPWIQSVWRYIANSIDIAHNSLLHILHTMNFDEYNEQWVQAINDSLVFHAFLQTFLAHLNTGLRATNTKENYKSCLEWNTWITEPEP